MAIEKLTKQAKQALFNYDNSKDLIELYYGSPDNNPIPVQNVLWIKIYENLFTLLPTLEIQLVDAGNSFINFNLKQGGVFYIRITPNYNQDENGSGKENLPYVDSQFVIQNLTCKAQPGNSKYLYSITCVYNALSYLNEIISYPKESGITIKYNDFIKKSSYAENSNSAIRNVLSKTSLKYKENFNTQKVSDYSTWINCNETRSQFIDRIVSHAWTKPNDSPILFTDRNGNCHYTSLDNLVNADPKVKILDIGVQNRIPSESKNDSLNRMYTNEILFLNNSGPIFNNGGYKIKQYVYKPEVNLSNIYSVPKMPGVLEDTSNTFMPNTKLGNSNHNTYSISTNLKYFESNAKQTKLATISNKSTSQMNNLTIKKDNGIHFNNTHEYYDVAPLHNENVRRSFFNIFVKFAIATKFLNNNLDLKKNRPELGDIIYIDFSYGNNDADKVHSGNYMVVGISNTWIKNGEYTLVYHCVTDGFFGDNYNINSEGE